MEGGGANHKLVSGIENGIDRSIHCHLVAQVSGLGIWELNTGNGKDRAVKPHTHTLIALTQSYTHSHTHTLTHTHTHSQHLHTQHTYTVSVACMIFLIFPPWCPMRVRWCWEAISRLRKTTGMEWASPVKYSMTLLMASLTPSMVFTVPRTTTDIEKERGCYGNACVSTCIWALT